VLASDSHDSLSNRTALWKVPDVAIISAYGGESAKMIDDNLKTSYLLS
jgi:ABC-type Fe2+-enterobactin transport system substrate-binding protein